MQLPLLVFDLDGVLVDSEPISERIFGQVLAEEGFVLEEGFSQKHFLGRSLRDCVAALQEHFGRVPSDEVLTGYLDRALEALRAELIPIEFVPEALAQLPHRKCIASGSELHRIELSLEVTGLRTYFEQITSSYEVAQGKPAPDVFLRAAEKMGFAPESCIVIEDTIFGVQAGVAAGMQVLCYQPLPTHAYPVPEGVVVFESMKALPQLVQRFS